MFESAFRSDELPPEERIERWRAGMPDLFRARLPSAENFYAEERHLGLGPVRASAKAYLPMELHRVTASPLASAPEVYEVVVPVSGAAHAELARVDMVTTAGGLYVHDITRVRGVAFRSEDGRTPYREFSVAIPKSLLALPEGRIERLFGERIPMDEGFGALLAGFLTRMHSDTASFGPSDGPRLGTIALDLVSALFGHLLSAESSLPSETRAGALTVRIRSFIQRHLADPELSPAVIARAHHISVSYLHRLFQPEGTTVSVYIRHQRLEQARRSLGEPELRGMPIQAIAARSGFANAADFSRAFRAAYGVPPRDYRHQALGGGPSAARARR